MNYLFVMLMGAINSSAVALAALPEFDLLLNWNDAPSIPIAPESAEAPSRFSSLRHNWIGTDTPDLRKEMLAHIRSAASLMHRKTFVVLQIQTGDARNAKDHPDQILVRLGRNKFIIETSALLFPFFKHAKDIKQLKYMTMARFVDTLNVAVLSLRIARAIHNTDEPINLMNQVYQRRR